MNTKPRPFSGEFYLGWNIFKSATDNDALYSAWRHGVRMRANSYELITSMIKTRYYEERTAFLKRQEEKGIY